MGHVENIPAKDAWRLMREDPSCRLIDVRTRAEWTFVGVPDLSEIGSAPILLEWQTYPAMEVQPDFVARLTRALDETGTPAEAPLFFLCRSGSRSLSAAQAVAGARDGRLINISDGFEGPPDAEGHRGRVAGWKAASLPWRQS